MQINNNYSLFQMYGSGLFSVAMAGDMPAELEEDSFTLFNTALSIAPMRTAINNDHFVNVIRAQDRAIAGAPGDYVYNLGTYIIPDSTTVSSQTMKSDAMTSLGSATQGRQHLRRRGETAITATYNTEVDDYFEFTFNQSIQLESIYFNRGARNGYIQREILYRVAGQAEWTSFVTTSSSTDQDFNLPSVVEVDAVRVVNKAAGKCEFVQIFFKGTYTSPRTTYADSGYNVLIPKDMTGVPAAQSPVAEYFGLAYTVGDSFETGKELYVNQRKALKGGEESFPLGLDLHPSILEGKAL